jgi:hypothetical protein
VNDPVEEIYRLREEHAKSLKYDARAMFEELKQLEAEGRKAGRKYVDFTRGQDGPAKPSGPRNRKAS